IAFFCANCGKDFRTDESLAGKKCKCRQCGHIFVIPGAKAPPAAAPRSLKTFGEETAAASSPPPRPRPAPDRPSAARSRTWPYGASPTEDDDAYGLADLPPAPPRAAVSARDDEEFLPPGELKPVKSRPKKKRNRSGGEVIAFFSGVPGQFYLYYLG